MMLALNAVPWASWQADFHLRVGPAGKCWSRRRLWLTWQGKELRFWSKVQPPMSKSFRRFEVLLPLRFNDQQPVPNDLIVDTLLELEQQFGAVSSETQIIRGHWHYERQSYRDDLVRVFVDVPDIPENRQFFSEFKERLKTRFQQIDIWMTTYPIEAL
jgi:hypothetical protein